MTEELFKAKVKSAEMVNVYHQRTVKHVTNNYQTLRMNNEKKDPMTNIRHVEMGSFDLKVDGEYRALSKSILPCANRRQFLEN